MAKSFGAEVTGVCRSKNLDLVFSIGADHVVDYIQADFTELAHQYNLIFYVVRKRSFSDCKQALKPDGIYITTEVSPSLMLQQKWVAMTGSQKLEYLPLMRPDKQYRLDLKQMLETRIVTPIIDRCYKLSEVSQALAYLGEGHARGKVIINLEQD